MKISDLKPGQILYDCHSTRMGSTTMKTLGVWRVRVIDVADDGTWFCASWNGNPQEKRYSIPSAWKAKKPYLVKGPMTTRRATTGEKKTGTFRESPDAFYLVKGDTNAD